MEAIAVTSAELSLVTKRKVTEWQQSKATVKEWDKFVFV
jgi:hypothetical protein